MKGMCCFLIVEGYIGTAMSTEEWPHGALSKKASTYPSSMPLLSVEDLQRQTGREFLHILGSELRVCDLGM